MIAGAGAAGVFAALACKEANPEATVTLLEKSATPLSKVQASGGGRCNLSHATHEPRKCAENYPRGKRVLRNALHQFGVTETIAWFKAHDLPLIAEDDGRIFPANNRAESVVDCLLNTARQLQISLQLTCGITAVNKPALAAPFTCTLTDGTSRTCDRLLIATGGDQDNAGYALARSLSHTIIEPIPALFALTVPDKRFSSLPGVAASDVTLALPGTRFSERGALLITHTGISGPVVLRLSSPAARYLFEKQYQHSCTINWKPDMVQDELIAKMKFMRTHHARMPIWAKPAVNLPIRLWQAIATAAGCSDTQQLWSTFTRSQAHELVQLLNRTTVLITGKDRNKSEFVTCGGVDVHEINVSTMESSICPGLYFAGEVMDVDGITGGFNLQAAWTTGWIAGKTMGCVSS